MYLALLVQIVETEEKFAANDGDVRFFEGTSFELLLLALAHRKSNEEGVVYKVQA